MESDLERQYSAAWSAAENRDTDLLRTSLTGAFSGTPDQLIDDLTRYINRTGKFDPNEIFGVIRSKNRSLELTEDRFWNMGYGSDQIHLLFKIWYRDFNYTPAYDNNLPQVDHIFPQSLLRTVKAINPSTGSRNLMRYRDAERNQLANCMLLTKQENGAGGKRDTPPDAWFVGQRADPSYLERHLIPGDPALWKLDRFDDFIAERKALIRAKFQPLLVSMSAKPDGGLTGVAGPRAANKTLAALIDRGVLKDGEMLSLTYKGTPVIAIARTAGVELSDGIYAPSEAAVRCYAELGSARPTENGWRVWKTASGATLNDLYVSIGGIDSADQVS